MAWSNKNSSRRRKTHQKSSNSEQYVYTNTGFYATGALLLLRPILIQSGLVAANRPFSTEVLIGLSYTVDEKELFRLNFFRLTFSTGSASQKSQSKTCFSTHRIAHPATKHTPKRPHPYQARAMIEANHFFSEGSQFGSSRLLPKPDLG